MTSDRQKEWDSEQFLSLNLKKKDKNSSTLSLPRAQVQSLFWEQKSYKPQLGHKKREAAAKETVIYIHLSIEAGLALTKNLNTSLKQKFNLFNIIKRYLLKVKPDVSKMALYMTLRKEIFT